MKTMNIINCLLKQFNVSYKMYHKLWWVLLLSIKGSNVVSRCGARQIGRGGSVGYRKTCVINKAVQATTRHLIRRWRQYARRRIHFIFCHHVCVRLVSDKHIFAQEWQAACLPVSALISSRPRTLASQDSFDIFPKFLCTTCPFHGIIATIPGRLVAKRAITCLKVPQTAGMFHFSLNWSSNQTALEICIRSNLETSPSHHHR